MWLSAHCLNQIPAIWKVLKIQCAKAHFATISNDSIVYDVVDSYKSLLEKVMR